jgi:hypothetical protein
LINAVSVKNVELIDGGAGIDLVNLDSPLVNGVIDLHGGLDALYLGNCDSSILVRNVELILAGSGSQSVTAGSDLNAVVDLGAGHDVLNMGNYDGNALVSSRRSSAAVATSM